MDESMSGGKILLRVENNFCASMHSSQHCTFIFVQIPRRRKKKEKKLVELADVTTYQIACCDTCFTIYYISRIIIPMPERYK